MKVWQRAFLLLTIAAVTVLAMGLRLRAVSLIPPDYDEDDYLAAGQRYAQAIRAGDWQRVIDYEFNYEHPPLTKLVYGLAILRLPEAPLLPELPSTAPPSKDMPQPHFRVARTTAAVFGTLEVLALSVLNPLAGLFLAAYTWQIKYTSQIMLEPLPSLASMVAVLLYFLSWRASPRLRRLLLAGSALALGITAASKYTYCVAGLAVAADWLWRTRPEAGQREPGRLATWIAPLLAWGALALLVFFALDPRLWNDPLGRLRQSLFFHAGYAQSAHVKEAGYPSWQPLVWLFGPVPWNPEVFLTRPDFFITLLAAAGLPRLFRRYTVFGLWLAIDLVFLLLWPTKWPQYILTLTAPLCLAASAGFLEKIAEPFASWLKSLYADLRPRSAEDSQPGPLARLARSRPVFSLGALAFLGLLLLWPAPGPLFRLLPAALLALLAVQALRERFWTLPGARPAIQDHSDQEEARLERYITRRDSRRALPWLLPGLVTLAIITVFPLIFQAAMSLTDFSATSIRDGIQGGVWRAVWQGLTGQVRAAPFDVFRGAASKEVHFSGPFILLELIAGAAPDLLVFNIIWTVLSVALQALLGISVALLLHRRGVQFRGWWRAIFILPWAIPEFVGALIWLRIFEPDYGWLAVNPNIPKDALILPALAQSLNQELLVLLIAATWYGFPFLFLAATAALKLAPDEVYDAAAIDGASGMRLFRNVTWPLLMPLVTPALIIRAIFAFNQFYLFYTLRTRLATYATVSYNFFSGGNGQFAVSAAINLFTVLVLIVLISRFDRWSKAAEGVTYV